jgi:hypothetical protein
LVDHTCHRRDTDGRIRILPLGSEQVCDAHVSILLSAYRSLPPAFLCNRRPDGLSRFAYG